MPKEKEKSKTKTSFSTVEETLAETERPERIFWPRSWNNCKI